MDINGFHILVAAIALPVLHWLQVTYIGLTLFRSKFKARIVYNSGHVVERWFYKLKVTYSTERGDGRLTGLEWNVASPGIDPLYWGMENIESITQIDVRKSIWSFFSN